MLSAPVQTPPITGTQDVLPPPPTPAPTPPIIPQAPPAAPPPGNVTGDGTNGVPPPMPRTPPPGQTLPMGNWELDGNGTPASPYKWIWQRNDPGTGSNPAGGGQDRGNPSGGLGGVTTPGGTPIDAGTPTSGGEHYGTVPIPPYIDPTGGFRLGGIVGGYTPPSADFGKNMTGVDMTVPGAAEMFYGQYGGAMGQAGMPMQSLYQSMLSKYGGGITAPTAGNAPAASFGALPTMGPGFGNLPTMGAGPGAFGAAPEVGRAPTSAFGALPTAQYNSFGNYFQDPQLPGQFNQQFGQAPALGQAQWNQNFNPQLPGQFNQQFGAYQGPTGAPTGQFGQMGQIGYQPATNPFANQYNPGAQLGDRFTQATAPQQGQPLGDFSAQNNAPADMSAYYDNAARKAGEQIRSSMSAKGMYGSSAADDQFSEAFTNLAADRAKSEAQYGLDQSANARSWEEARTGYNLNRSQDALARGNQSLAYQQAGADYAVNRSQDELARSQNALDWEKEKAGYGLNLSQDALARNSQALDWQKSSKQYEMDVAQYGVDVANQKLAYQQQNASFGLDAYQQNLARSSQALDWTQAGAGYEQAQNAYGLDRYNAQLGYQNQAAQFGLDAYSQNLARNQQALGWQQAGAGYDATKANYGLDLMGQQLAGQQAAANYGLNVSQDAIARGQLGLAYTQAQGQYNLGLGSQNIDRYNAQVAGQQAQSNYGLNAYNAQLAGQQAAMNYGLNASQDAIARANLANQGQQTNLAYLQSLGNLANASGQLNLNAMTQQERAAVDAQLAQRTRGQDAFSNAMGYGSATSATMGSAYNGMFGSDAAIFNAMQQLALGKGAEGLSQALMQFGLTQDQINQFMGMAGGASKIVTGAGLGGGGGYVAPNGNTGIAGPAPAAPAGYVAPNGNTGIAGLMPQSQPQSLMGPQPIAYTTVRNPDGSQSTMPVYA
jgi:hypothetical protein